MTGSAAPAATPPPQPATPPPARRSVAPTVEPRSLRDRAATVVGRRRLLAAALALLAGLLLTVLGLLLADGSLALSAPLRTLALPLVGLACVAGLLAIWSRRRHLRPDSASAARLASDACGDQQRHLLVALDLADRPGDLAAAGAARAAARIPQADLAKGLPDAGLPRRWGLLGAIAAGALLIAVLVPRFYPTVLPRFLDPGGDHPPFSFTQLHWETVPERVRSGDPARCEVRVDGAHDGLVLHAANPDGRLWSVPMFRIGDGIFAGEIAAVREPLRVWIAGGGTRTHYRELGIDPLPVLRGLAVTVQAPAYAGLPDEERDREATSVEDRYELLTGSRLLLRPSANRPLAALHCRRGDGDWLRLPLTDGVAVWTDPDPGTWMLRLEGADGIHGEELPLASISRRPDLPPRTRIEEPARHALATPDLTIPLHLQADDDLGLATVTRVRGWNGLAAPDLQEPCSDREWSWRGALDLTELGVAPGDVITIATRARDRHPDGGQRAEPTERQIRIISAEEYRRQLRQRLSLRQLRRRYQPLLDALRELEARVGTLARQRREGGGDPAKQDRDLAELARDAQALADRVAERQQRDPLVPMERELQRQLADQAQALAEAAADGSLDEALQEMAGALDQDLALLEALAKGHALMARLRQLIDAQQNTTRQLATLAVHRRLSDTERVRLRELATQEDDLAQALDAWQELAPRLAQELRAFPQGERPAQQIEELLGKVVATQAGDSMRRAAVEGRRAAPIPARQHAAAARDALLALLPPVQRAQQGLESGALGLGLGDLADLLQSLRDMGQLAANGFGWGIGGAGVGGAGFSLGYGGDDLLGTGFGLAMDLYGPDGVDRGHQHASGFGRGDAVAAMAAAGGDPATRATPYAREVRRTTTGTTVHLDPAQEDLVADYYRHLEEDR